MAGQLLSENGHPFVGLERTSGAIQAVSGAKNFGPGYLLLDILNERAKGSAFLALCVKSQQEVAAKVLKQGRQYCMSDRYGRDARWILKRELEYHRYLASVPGIPRADEYFEVGGDGYLVIDHVDGQSIEAFVSKTLGRRQWAVVEQTTRLRVLKTLVSFLELVAVLHDRGFVHRDLSNANVWVRRDDTTALSILKWGTLSATKNRR